MNRVHAVLATFVVAAIAGCTRDADVTTAPITTRPQALLGSTLTVSNTDDDGVGSLRFEMRIAQPGDNIQFDVALAGQTITLTSGQLQTDKVLTIEGPATGGIVIDASASSRVFFVSQVADVTLRNLTLTNGRAPNFAEGGGVLNIGKLLLDHVTVSGNVVDWTGLGAVGGGLANDPTGTLTLVNSTVSGNRSASSGSGVFSSGSLSITNSTIANNDGGTGLVVGNGSLSLRNSIIANNAPALASDNDCKILVGPVTVAGKNLVGTPGNCVIDATVMVGDPKLGPLADNGGPAKTQTPLIGSPVVDAATDCNVTDDERHVARPQGAACDLGAVEFTDYIKTPITIDNAVTVNPTNGVAVVTGTLSCTLPSSVTLHVELTQAQKQGKVPSIAKATNDLTIDCTGPKAWAMSLIPPTGGFEGGTATIAAKTVNVGTFTAPATLDATVRMAWGHK